MPYFGVRAKSDLMIEDSFQDSAGVVERKPDAQREQAGRRRISFIQVRGCSSRCAQM